MVIVNRQAILGIVSSYLTAFDIDHLGGQFKIRTLQLFEIRKSLEGKDDEE